MDQNELFRCSRNGDLTRIKWLVEQKDTELNVRDKWDSTPLYYACLCGHKDVVQYLLENGAKCEANTFDGERCLYGALNSEIRHLLKNFKVITSMLLKRDNYAEFLRRCFDSGEYHDVCFLVHDVCIPAHCCILSSRCEHFRDLFLGRWRHRKAIHISNPLVTVDAFVAVLRYLYTGRLETHFENLDDCIALVKQCGLLNLIDEIDKAVNKVKLFECTKPGTRITTLLVEPSSHFEELQQDFKVLAESTLPNEFHEWVGGNELPFLPSFNQSLFGDICFNVQGHKFLCHKLFICGRSDFFKAVVADHFKETIEVEGCIRQISLNDISADVFVQVLYYIYHNCVDLNLSNVFDVLCAADVYLLPGLKYQCAALIGQHLDVTNVVTMLKVARMYRIPRLEDQCSEFISKHLEQITDDSEFQAFVLNDAKEVLHRQQTDSISIIDDIRYHITSNVQTFSAMEDANEKLHIIDELLEKLGLDA